MNTPMLNNLRAVARGGWHKLGKEEQEELTSHMLVGLDEYDSPVITTTGSHALKERQ